MSTPDESYDGCHYEACRMVRMRLCAAMSILARLGFDDRVEFMKEVAKVKQVSDAADAMSHLTIDERLKVMFQPKS